jgi:hypothetical protein
MLMPMRNPMRLRVSRQAVRVAAGVIARTTGVMFVLVAPVVVGGCRPELGAPPSLVSGPQLLDVRSRPAEAKPGTDATLEALVVDAGGTLAASVAWTICRTPKPPAESNAVSRACVDQPDELAPMAGPATIGVPVEACTLFGPLAPPAQPGQPGVRPRDPDPTGGFYQPIRAVARGVPGADADLMGFALVRVSCALANAPVDVARAFNNPDTGYHANQAPTLQSVTMTDTAGVESTVVDAGVSSPAIVSTGASVTLRVSWPPESAETFPVFDLVARRLVDAREALRVSWFMTAGELLHDRTGRDSDDAETFTANEWRAPTVADATTVHFWIVLRDSRGGSDSVAFDLTVTP